MFKSIAYLELRIQFNDTSSETAVFNHALVFKRISYIVLRAYYIENFTISKSLSGIVGNCEVYGKPKTSYFEN